MGKLNELRCDAWNCGNKVSLDSNEAESWYLLEIYGDHDDPVECYCSWKCLSERMVRIGIEGGGE